MAKKTAKNAKSNELDSKEFFAAISLIEKEKGIPKSYIRFFLFSFRFFHFG